MNYYENLVEGLKSGKMGLKQIDIAVMEWIYGRTDLPEAIKNLLVQRGGGGIVRWHFTQIASLIGNMELAYRRGIDVGRSKK